MIAYTLCFTAIRNVDELKRPYFRTHNILAKILLTTWVVATEVCIRCSLEDWALYAI